MRDMLKRTGKRMLGARINHGTKTIGALRNISLDVRDGDRLGIIGHNGAGKTTLLRVMAGIYEPTSGSAQIKGHVSTLIDAAPGLNANNTGLEAIRTCALHLGMSRSEINDSIDEIAEFSELGEYLEMPVRIYSSGMATRLSFAIATSIAPEVLILDEGLATGDAAFAAKAQQRIKSLINRSAIVVFASHSPTMLKGMCTRGIVLEQGNVVEQGSVSDIITAYQKRVVAAAAQGDKKQQDAAYNIARDLVKRGEAVPLDVEEQALYAAVARVPDDINMKARLARILAKQGKPVPPELRVVELEQAAISKPNNQAVQKELAELRAQGYGSDPTT